MTRRLSILLVALGLALAACAFYPDAEIELPDDPNAPVIQVRYEGGFAPIEYLLGGGPAYTLLADGRLIYEGPTTAIYPSLLLRGYLVTQLEDDDMEGILDFVSRIGLPGIEFEYDDSAADRVMDAGNAEITYWNGQGEHVYSVYALGLGEFSSRRATKAFEELTDFLRNLTVVRRGDPYQPERIQVIAGIGFTDPEFDDVRDWPLRDTDLSSWTPVVDSWVCRTYGPEIIEAFTDATEATRWRHPDPMMDAPAYTLLVRALHPGEPDCPSF
jgi:hypothetical protein